jgi:hypothetical protein
MYDQNEMLAAMARERQAEMRRAAATENMLRDAGVPKAEPRPMPRKLIAALSMAALIVFIFAQSANAAH